MKPNSFITTINTTLMAVRSFFSNTAFELLDILRSQKILMLIMLIAAWLRLWQLDHNAIFFGDAGRDFLAAQEMVQTGQIPLKGIATSVPVFHQGPLMVWMLGFAFLIGNNNPIWVFSLFAALCVLTVVLVFWGVEKFTKNSTAALLATLMIATSPLAVAHSRMAYHITLIPLLTLMYLFALIQIVEKKKFSVFWAGLCWGLLFQLELSLLPLLLVLPYALVRSKQFQLKHFFILTAGGVIGVLPFFAQAPIVFQKILNKLHGDNSIFVEFQQMIDYLPLTGQHFSHYFTRFFSIDQHTIAIAMGLVSVIAFVNILRQYKKLPIFIELAAISFLILTLGYVFRGQPSEAYMPPYFIFLPVLVAYGLTTLSSFFTRLIVGLIVLLALYNTVQIPQHNFLVTPTLSQFHYGIGFGEQVQVMKKVIELSGNSPYVLSSTAPENRFHSYLDNVRYVGTYLGKKEESTSNTHSQTFFIEPKNTTLLGYPNADIYEYPSVYLISIPEL